MPKPRPRPRYRCRFCGVTFSAWLAVPGEPDGALLLHHISQSHPRELGRYLDQMPTTDDITPAILQAYEEVEEPATPTGLSLLRLASQWQMSTTCHKAPEREAIMTIYRHLGQFHRSALLWLLLLTATCWLLAQPDVSAQGSGSTPLLPPELEKIRSALDKYQDPIMAVHDGYFSTVGCVAYPSAGGPGQVPYPAGGMGVHFLNPALLGPEVDPFRPQVLVYEPVGDQLRLVAAEWFVPLTTGVKERPQLFSQPFDGPMEGHHPLMPSALHHYDLHVWLWKSNPAGVFSATNPDMKCPTSGYSLMETAPKLVPHP